MTGLLILGGLVSLVLGAELLVRGASRLADAIGIPPLIVGLTVVAFGTSAPELAVSVSSAWSGKADLALGNILGSNIFNVFFILGLSALIVPLVVDKKLVRFDVPLMIGVSLLVLVLSQDGRIGRLEGMALFAGLLGYLIRCVIAGRHERPPIESGQPVQEAPDEFTTTEAGAGRRSRAAGFAWQFGLIAAGLVLLVSGSNWLVTGATELARWFGISELVIGLTIIAGGTSLPEVATSIIAAVRGERDIAVGNVVGSNLFNLTGVLGLTAAVAPEGVAVAGQALHFDLPVMVASATACLPVFFTGHLIARWEGGLFFLCYAIYVTSLVLLATRGDSVPALSYFMNGLVVPLTAITLVVIVIRELKERRAQAS